MHVLNVEKKGNSIETLIDISDEKGKGRVILKFWGPHKKTGESTVQANMVKGSERRYVTTLMKNFVKPVIDRIYEGGNVESLFKSVSKKPNLQEKMVRCNECDKTFKSTKEANEHKKSDRMKYKCHGCDKGFKTAEIL